MKTLMKLTDHISEFISRLPSHYIVIKSSMNLVLEVFWIPIEKIMSYGNSGSFAFVLYNLDPFVLLSNISGLEPAAQCGIELIKAVFYLLLFYLIIGGRFSLLYH